MENTKRHLLIKGLSTQRGKILDWDENGGCCIKCPLLGCECRLTNEDLANPYGKCCKCPKKQDYEDEKAFARGEIVERACSGQIDTPMGKANTKRIRKTWNGFKMLIDCPNGFGDCWWVCTDIDNKGVFKCPYCKKCASKAGVEKIKAETREEMRNTQWRRDIHNASTWNKLRYLVLKRDGGRCCLCGRSAADGVKLHIDHIKPASIYPDLYYDPDNLQTLCEECNLGKSDLDDTDWRK